MGEVHGHAFDVAVASAAGPPTVGGTAVGSSGAGARPRGSRRRLAAAIGDLRHPDGRDLADGLFRHGIPCRDRELVRGSTVAALIRIRALAGVEVPQSP